MLEIPGLGRVAVPRTCAEIDQIQNARETLSSQLSSARGRREDTAEELRQAVDGADKAGLESYLKTLDVRINSLETQLALTGHQLANQPANLTCTAFNPDNPGALFDRIPQAAFIAIPIVFTIFVLGPIGASIARLIWRRSSRRNDDLPAWSETAERLHRLETAVDTVAIEIERISENQRFVTKVLAESRAPAAVVAGKGSDPH
jgi:hypothetical protein